MTRPMHEHMCFGCLTNGLMLFVKGIFVDKCIFYFHSQLDNKLQPYTPLDNLLQNLLVVLVRVIVKSGKKWLIDPQPSVAHLWNMFWLYAQQPISRVCGIRGDRPRLVR